METDDMPSFNALQRGNQQRAARRQNAGPFGGSGRGGGAGGGSGRITKMFVGNLSFDTTWQGTQFFNSKGKGMMIDFNFTSYSFH